MPCRPTHIPSGRALFVLPGPNPGLLKDGNIDLWRRPFAHNPLHPEASGSTVASESWDIEEGKYVGNAILISTVVPLTPVTARGFTGRVLTAKGEALTRALREHRHLGIFENWHYADRYSDRLHLQQQRIYSC